MLDQMEWDKLLTDLLRKPNHLTKAAEVTVLNNAVYIEVRDKRESSNQAEVVKDELEDNIENWLKQGIQSQGYITMCNLE